jgi:hypothetical protein
MQHAVFIERYQMNILQFRFKGRALFSRSGYWSDSPRNCFIVQYYDDGVSPLFLWPSKFFVGTFGTFGQGVTYTSPVSSHYTSSRCYVWSGLGNLGPTILWLLTPYSEPWGFVTIVSDRDACNVWHNHIISSLLYSLIWVFLACFQTSCYVKWDLHLSWIYKT